MRGLDPRIHLPLPTLPRERGRVGRGLDCRVKSGNDGGDSALSKNALAENEDDVPTARRNLLPGLTRYRGIYSAAEICRTWIKVHGTRGAVRAWP
jgi:hypothetical protein